MSAQHEIAKLDRQLAAKGEPVVFRREDFNTGSTDVPTRAFVRGYAPEELVGGIDAHSSKVILSPTDLVAAGFTPKKGDFILVAGKSRFIDVAETRRIGADIVRFDLTVSGK